MKFKHIALSSLLLLSLYGCSEDKEAEKILLGDETEDIEINKNDISVKNILGVMKDNLEISEDVGKVSILEQELPLYKNKEGNIEFFIAHSEDEENSVDVVDLLEVNGTVNSIDDVQNLFDDLIYAFNGDKDYVDFKTFSPVINEYTYTDKDVSILMTEEKLDNGKIEFKIVVMPLFNPNK